MFNDLLKINRAKFNIKKEGLRNVFTLDDGKL